MASLLNLEGISKRYGATQALSDVSIHIDFAEVHALIGENGAGKSTLMKILSGAIVADNEAIYLDGDELALATPVAVSTVAAAGGIEGAENATATAGVPVVSVDAAGKLATQWGALKGR